MVLSDTTGSRSRRLLVELSSSSSVMVMAVETLKLDGRC